MSQLEGRTILVTRPAHQAADLAQPLMELGAEVVLMPAIEIAAPLDSAPLDQALTHLEWFDTVVLTSVNGVEAVKTRMAHLNVPDEKLSEKTLAVIGPSTGAALAAWLREPDVTPAEYVSEAIAEGLGEVKGKRILLARADLARKDLAVNLKEAGAEVTEVVTYRIIRPEGNIDLPAQAPDAITVTSAEAARATAARLEKEGRQSWMKQAKIVCIGPITADAVRTMGIEPAAIAETYTIPGLIQALLECLSQEAAHV